MNVRADQHGTKGIWVHRMLHLLCDLELWLWPWILKVKFKKKLYHRNKRVDWHGTKRMWVDRMDVGPNLWLYNLTSPMTLTLDFQGQIFNNLVLWMGRLIDLEWKMWVGYHVGCTMGLLLGHSAWQIHWLSNGSMWNPYSFQPVGPWMGYSFSNLRAEWCCHSLNALL